MDIEIGGLCTLEHANTSNLDGSLTCILVVRIFNRIVTVGSQNYTCVCYGDGWFDILAALIFIIGILSQYDLCV